LVGILDVRNEKRVENRVKNRKKLKKGGAFSSDAAVPPLGPGRPPRRTTVPPPFFHRRRRRYVRERREQNREERERQWKNKQKGSYTLFIVVQNSTRFKRTKPAQSQFPQAQRTPLVFLHLFIFCTPPLITAVPPLLYFIFLIFFCTFSFVFFPLALHFFNSHAF